MLWIECRNPALQCRTDGIQWKDKRAILYKSEEDTAKITVSYNLKNVILA